MLRILSLFSGIGAFESALNRLGIEYEIVNYCEIDKYASKAYSLIHDVDESKNLGDITKINLNTLPKDIDLITYGFPCVPKGYMIKTNQGYKPIEEINIGDYVLTHNNVYKKVLKTMNRISNHIYTIKGVGCWDLQLTEEHPLYTYRNGSFQWVKTKDIKNTDKLVYNINQKQISTDWDNNMLWLFGRYIADGYCSKDGRAIFCIGKNKIKEFEQYIAILPHSIYHKERNCWEYKLLDEEIGNFIYENFKTGSKNKIIPQWILDLPVCQLKYFLEGYLSGDGHRRKDRNTTMFTTTNLNICLGLQDIIIKLYNIVPTISYRKNSRKETYSSTYNGQFSDNCKNQEIIEDKIIVSIKNITRLDVDIMVYNFEVADDNSYTVNNVIVHNCQDISIAGKMKGFKDVKGEMTRSGLLYKAFQIIEHIKPKIAIFENVKNLISKKFKSDLESYLDDLDDIGYNTICLMLNAKDFNVPQNRERVFGISIRDDIKSVNNILYNLANIKKQELTKTLFDIIDNNVNEKYFVSNKQYKYIFDLEDNLNKVWKQKKMWLNPLISSTLCAKSPKSERAFMKRYIATNTNNLNILVTDGIKEQIKNNEYIIRTLTPLEYFRLMGFNDDEFNKIKDSFSDTQLYKMAGNSIVVDVLVAIFNKIYN